ncbi:MAG: hypothetical protein Kow0037_31840 [Calditrichia bacterium]
MPDSLQPACPTAPEFAVSQPDSAVILQWLPPDSACGGAGLDTLSHYQVWRNDSLLAEVPYFGNNGPEVFIDVAPRADYYRYSVCAVDTAGNVGERFYFPEVWLGGAVKGFVILELDPTPSTGEAIRQSLIELGYPPASVYFERNYARYPLNPAVEAVFVSLGISGRNYPLSDAEGQYLLDYLLNGGNVYLEGGDTWYADPMTPIHWYFQVVPLDDGAGDLNNVFGEPGSIFENLAYVYAGENFSIDRLGANSYSEQLFYNPVNNAGVAIGCHAGNYNTIGASWEFGKLQNGQNTRTQLLEKMLQFFSQGPLDIQNREITNQPNRFNLYPAYPNPFNGTTHLQVQLPEAGRLRLEIYNILGQKVFGKKFPQVEAGLFSLNWNGAGVNGQCLPSGSYFARIKYEGLSGEKVFRVVKIHLAQ